MDVHLGDVNGIELVKRMRRAHIGPDVPVIVVTSDRIRETVLDAMAADVQGYLLKPYEPRILADKVGAVLEKWKAELPRV
jgi:DNA-binding NarL/FixJ family response regulator